MNANTVTEPNSMMIVITCGLEDGGCRAALAFGAALAALAHGDTVHVFLSLQAVVLGTPTGARDLRPRGFSESLDAYIEHFVDLGGKIELCSSCYDEYCDSQPRDEHGRAQLRPGTTIQGLGILATRAHAMPVITF